MKKIVFAASITIFLFLLVAVFLNRQSSPEPLTTPTPAPQMEINPGAEEAELTGFQFILDFIDSAPPSTESAYAKTYDALSENAKKRVSEEHIGRDLAAFVGVQDVPDQGASVEDLQMNGDKATLIVGLNFSGGRTLRAIHLVVENGQWKVDNITPLTQYP